MLKVSHSIHDRYIRAQILIPPDQRDALQAIARQEKRSISDIVREFIAVQLRQRKYQEMSAAAERLKGEYDQGDLAGMTVLDGEDFLHEQG